MKPSTNQGTAESSPISSSNGGCSRCDIVRTSLMHRSSSSTVSSMGFSPPSLSSLARAMSHDILIAARYCPIPSCSSSASLRRSSSCRLITRADSSRSSALVFSSCRRRCSEIVAAVTISCARGTSPGSAIAVTTDASAVTTLISPESQYSGFHNTTTSIRCVNPQATINNPNARNIQPNGISRRVLLTRYSSVHEIATYDSQISVSVPTCSAISCLSYR